MQNVTSGTVTISCKPSPQDARGVSEHVMNELGKFGLTQESFVKDNRILFTTHDGASAMVKQVRCWRRVISSIAARMLSISWSWTMQWTGVGLVSCERVDY